MSTQSALIERMSNAVRSAYKAMEVLKEENRVLKVENEELRRQLQLASGTGSDSMNNDVQIIQTTTSPERSINMSVSNNDNAVDLETSKIAEGKLDKLSQENNSIIAKVVVSENSNIHDNLQATGIKTHSIPIQQSSTTPSKQDNIKHMHRTVLPITQSLELIPMKEENGHTKFTHKRFRMTPDAIRFVQHLKELRYSNIHYIAGTLVHHSMLTLCKAMMMTISSYISDANIQEWNKTIQSAFSDSFDDADTLPLLTIHVSILKQLDLLMALIVSMASRVVNGVIHTHQLLEIFKKVIFGSIRCQLVSAQYAVMMGTARVNRVPSVPHRINNSNNNSNCNETIKPISQQSPDHQTVLSCLESDNSKKNVDHHIGLEKQEGEPRTEGEEAGKSEFKAALASMFGIGSDSDGDKSGTDEVHWGVPSNNPLENINHHTTTVTTDTRSADRDDDATSHHSMEEEQELENSDGGERNSDNNSSNHSDSTSDSEGSVRSTGSGRMEVDLEVEGDNEEQEEINDTRQQKTTGTMVHQHLEMACRIYALITPLLRLRLYDALVEVLVELSLVTAGNMCFGCVAGVVSIFGSARYNAVLKVSKIRKQLCALVKTWLWSTPAETEKVLVGESEVEHSLHDLTIPTLKRFWAYLTTTNTEASLPQELRTMEANTEQLAVALRKSSASSSTAPVDDVLMGYLCRRLGFWGSVAVLCPVSSSPRSPSPQSSNPFSVLGLDKLPRYAQEWHSILSWWDPARKPSNVFKEEAPSLAQFVQSDDYFLSEVQSEVLSSLRAAGMHTLKYIDQEQLVLSFAKKWTVLFTQHTHAQEQVASSSTNIKQTIKAILTMKILYQSFLHTEYEKGEGGWRTGLSGDGFRLASRLDNRLTVGVTLLRRIPFAQYFISSALGVVLKPSLKWMHFSSTNGRKLLECAEFVDHCERHILRDYVSTALAEGEGGNDSSTEEDKTTAIITARLYAVCTEITTLLSLESLEAAMSVSASSVRGLLHALYNHTRQDTYSLQKDHIELLHAATSFLRILPAPWSGVCRTDILCEQQRCWYTLARSPTTISSGVNVPLFEETTSPCSSDHSLRLCLADCAPCHSDVVNAMPVFLINLDKRFDRYRRSLVTLNQANLSVIRVRAWDGTTEQTAASAAEMFQRSFTSTSSGWSDTTNVNAAVGVKVEDLYSDIPESDVQLTWDTTLNAKFDSRCAANTAVIATPSERACAASHLRVWRTIAEICGIKTATKSILRQSALARAAAVANAESGPSSGSTGVGSNNLLPSLVEQYNSVIGRDNDKSIALGGLNPNTTNTTASITEVSVQNASAALLSLEHDLAGHSVPDYFVIFEDDVNFPQHRLVDLRVTIRDLMAAVPTEIDILYLGGVLPKGVPDFKLTRKKNEPFYGVNYVWTLQAYVLRRRAVEVLLSKLPITAPVDNFIASLIYNKELKACIVKDKLTQQLYTLVPGRGRRIDSDIHPSGRAYGIQPSHKRLRSDITTTQNSIEKKGKGKGNRSKKGKR